MGNGVLTAAEVAGIHASVTALNALFRDDAQLRNVVDGTGPDVLQRAYELRLERLGVVARLEAQIAALKARDAAEAVELQNAMTPPDARLQERTFREISVVEEIAGILTISSGAAGAFVTQARRVCSLPSVYGALSTGSLSWQGARIIADETENLDYPAAVALADHFLDPDAPNPARGRPAGQLVPSRLRSKVRAWRERHHPESIEKRHAKSAADRRVEFTPDRDGMAWFAIYMRADCALAAWNKTTAIARGLQGPNETRTLTQIRADEVARRLLAPAQAITTTTDAGTGTGSGSGSGSGPSMASPAGGGDTEGTGGQRGSQPGTSTPAAGDGSGRPDTGDEVQRVAGDQFPDEFLGLATLFGSDELTADLGIPDALAAVSLEASSAGTQDNSTGQAGTCTTTAFPDAIPEAGKVPRPRADVLVTVPVFALLGLTDEPAILDGYGPIPASMARKLLADGAESFTRVLIDPRDGAPLEIGRTSYRLTKAMRQALTLRDGKCTFPGCNNNALDNEADHLTAWQHGGTTGISNLAQLCPKHHRLKHNSGWTPTHATETEPPCWTSPTGRTYPAEQPGWEPPQLPPALAALLTDGAAPGNPGSGWSAARKRGSPAAATDEQQVVLAAASEERYPAATAAGTPEAGEDLVCPPWLEWGDMEITDADVPDPDNSDDAGFPDDPELLEYDPAKDPFPDWLLWLEAEEAALSHP
ncbi:DUF222 domain-containing protein [Pseudarthrobacter sp. NPDC089323]